jgi:hypothetical protein
MSDNNAIVTYNCKKKSVQFLVNGEWFDIAKFIATTNERLDKLEQDMRLCMYECTTLSQIIKADKCKE